jgi:hypothetical protein
MKVPWMTSSAGSVNSGPRPAFGRQVAVSSCFLSSVWAWPLTSPALSLKPALPAALARALLASWLAPPWQTLLPALVPSLSTLASLAAAYRAASPSQPWLVSVPVPPLLVPASLAASAASQAA